MMPQRFNLKKRGGSNPTASHVSLTEELFLSIESALSEAFKKKYPHLSGNFKERKIYWADPSVTRTKEGFEIFHVFKGPGRIPQNDGVFGSYRLENNALLITTLSFFSGGFLTPLQHKYPNQNCYEFMFQKGTLTFVKCHKQIC